MNTKTAFAPTENVAAVNTVAQPLMQSQSNTIAPINSGTVGHSGAVKYSSSAAAMVSETYVIATKK
jgi:hypothetical protein